MQKKVIRCSECEHCKEIQKYGNTRSDFFCEHSDKEYIRNYYEKHGIRKMEGFLGFGKRWSHEVPLKTSPAWCPEKAEQI